MDIRSLRVLHFYQFNYHIFLECLVSFINEWNVLFIIGIISYNPITLILTDNKLIEPNYIDWKRNLDIVPIIE